MRNAKTLCCTLSILLFLCTLQQPLYAAETKDNSIGKATRKNDNSFMQWGNLSGDTTDLSTFLLYDSLVLQPDQASCEQAAIASFHIVIIYQDTASLNFELTSNKITEEIKETINKLPNVNRIIIENIKICCTVNGKELTRYSKFTAEYTIIQD